MSVNYAWEKFFDAVLSLARSRDNIKTRLKRAYIESIHFVDIEDIPENALDDFKYLENEITRAESFGAEGLVAASIDEMSEDEIVKLIEKIVSIYDKVVRKIATNKQG